MKLSFSEETLMALLWNMESAYMKELIEQYPDPKPAVTTIATLLKRMQDKGFVAYNKDAGARKYYALIEKDKYVSDHLDGVLSKFFGNSISQFASFFTRKKEFTQKELRDLRDIIDKKIDQNI